MSTNILAILSTRHHISMSTDTFRSQGGVMEYNSSYTEYDLDKPARSTDTVVIELVSYFCSRLTRSTVDKTSPRAHITLKCNKAVMKTGKLDQYL